jgi:hypothetical protein
VVEVLERLSHKVAIHKGYEEDSCPHKGVKHTLAHSHITKPFHPLHSRKFMKFVAKDKTKNQFINNLVVLLSEK